jgi:cephalosporin-C deacetylase-like acetyl esterase
VRTHHPTGRPARGRAAALIVLLAAASGGQAQTRNSADQRYKMFQDYLARRATEVTRSHLEGIRSLQDLQRRRPELKRQFLSMLSLDPMPAKTPLKPRITGSFEREGYRVEKIVFESMPRLYVTGNLYLPARVDGRLPTVVYVSGHSPGPWGAKVDYQHHGIWMARHGYAAFLLDTVEFGEIPGIHHGTHDLEMWYWLSLGYTPAGPEVWNAIRALDYLETRPEVDAKRAAITGISGGGAITWYTAAVDERFQVAAPVCATWTVGDHTVLDAVHHNCDCIYFVNTYLADLPLAGALIAPRPLKILSATRDISFPRPGYKEVYRQVKRIYDLYGAGEKVQEYEHEAPHQDILPFRKEAYEWLNRWLKNDPAPFDEGNIKREEPAQLMVLTGRPADAVNDHIHKLFVPVHRSRPFRTLKEWNSRRAELSGQLKDMVFRGFPDAKAPFDTWTGSDRGWPSRYAEASSVEFTTERGIRVHGQLFVPRSAGPHPALIYVKGAADVVYPVDYDLMLPAFGNHVVLVLLPRAVDYPANNYKMATMERTAALIGATMGSMQIWDILRAIDWLKEQRKDLSSITVYGRRQMGGLALYAAALDERISRVILDDPPASHWQGPALLNVLRLTDLPEAAAMVAPRELVSLTPLPDSYGYTRSVYSLLGQKSKIREVGGLSQALNVR